MTRALALLAVLIALAALVWSGNRLAHATAARPELDAPRLANPPAPSVPEDAPAAPRVWAPIFGALAPKVQAAPPAAAPQLPYVLKGTVSLGGTRLAILSRGGTETVVHVGDELDGGIVVARITAKDVAFDVGQDTVTVSFADDTPVQTARLVHGPDKKLNVEAVEAGALPELEQVRYQGISSTDLLEKLRQAEAARK